MMSPSDALGLPEGALVLSRSQWPIHLDTSAPAGRNRAVQRDRHRHLSAARSCTRSRRRASRRSRTAFSTRTTSAREAEGRRRRRAWPPSCCTFSARSRSSSGSGRSCCSWRWSATPAGSRRSTTSTTRSTTPSRSSSSSSWRWPRRGRSSASPKPRCGASPTPGGGTPAAWWVTILIIGPLLGSFITEPAAMTICALLLARQFYDLQPSTRLKYATLGLLFVNVSIGGTLTHFAAPPVLMVARPWDWDTPFMLGHFGWRAALAIVVSTLVYFVIFRRELARAGRRGRRRPDVDVPEDDAAAHGRAPARAGVADRRAHGVHGVDGPHRALSRRSSSAASCSSSASPRATAAYQSRIELQGAAARRILPGRTGDPRRAAGLVDRAGARQPVGDAAVPQRDAADGVQRQRAHHVPRDAGAEPRANR